MLLRCIRAENRKLHASPIWFMFLFCPSFPPGTEPSTTCKTLKFCGTAGTVCGPSTHYFTRYFSSLHGSGIRGVPVAAGAHRPQLEPDYGGAGAALLPVPCQVACGDKAGTADSGICVCIVLVLRPGVRRVHSAPPAITIFYLVRSVLGRLAVVAAQLLFSMVIRSFALPVFLGLAGVFPACC